MSFLHLRAKIIREGAWVVAGQALIIVAMLVGLRVLTQFVPPDTYGNVALLLGALVLGQQTMCYPVLLSGFRFYSDMPGRTWTLRRLIRRDLVRMAALLATIVLVGGAAWSIVGGLSYLSMIALAALVAIEAKRSVEINFLSGARRQRPVAVWQSAEAWAKPIAAVGLVLLAGAGTNTVLAGYVLAEGLVLGSMLAIVRRDGLAPAPGEEQASGDTSVTVAAIRKFAWPVAPLAITFWIQTTSNRFIIGAIKGPADVGVFAAVLGLIAQPFLMGQGVLSQTLQPVHFHAVSAGDWAKERRVFVYWLLGTAGISLVGVVAIYFLKDLIAALALAEKYRVGAPFMPWIALGYGLFAMAQVCWNRLLAFKRTRVCLLANTVGAVTAVVATATLVYFYGVIGAAIACPCYFLVLLAVLAALAFSQKAHKAT